MSKYLAMCDLLSREIKIRSNGSWRNSSTIGGVLTLVMFMTTLGVSVFFLTDMLDRRNPKAYLVQKNKDEGNMTMTQDQNFHVISLNDGNTFAAIDLNDRKFTITGALSTFAGKLLTTYKYARCVESDFKGLTDLFNLDTYVKEFYYCIRSMTDLEGKTYSVGEEGFYYPYMTLAKASDRGSLIWYSTILNKCVNSTKNNNHCMPDSVMNKDLTGSNLNFQFVDNIFDVGSYETPVQKFINIVNSGTVVGVFKTISINYIPVSLTTHDGLMFDNVVNVQSYQYTTKSSSNSNTVKENVAVVNQYFLNNAQFYERSYSRLQDVAAQIGGFKTLVTMIALIVNYPFCRFTIFQQDMEISKSMNILTEREKRESLKSFQEMNEAVKKYGEMNNTNNQADVVEDSVNQKRSSTVHGRAQSLFTVNNFIGDMQTKEFIKSKIDSKLSKPHRGVDRHNTIFEEKKVGFIEYMCKKFLCCHLFKNETKIEYLKDLFLDEKSIYMLHCDMIRLKKLMFNEDAGKMRAGYQLTVEDVAENFKASIKFAH